jgi:hypothetical protein
MAENIHKGEDYLQRLEINRADKIAPVCNHTDSKSKASNSR